MTKTISGRRVATPKKAATLEQYYELKRLGYTGSSSSLYSYELAEEKLEKYRAKAAETPALVPAWERGEAMLDTQGYTVEYMEDYHYRITRPSGKPANNPDGITTSYHVSLNPKADGTPACDCPDSTRHGDEHTCKHILAVSVWLWRIAQEAADDYTEYLESAGVLRLRRAYEAGKKAKPEEPGVQESLLKQIEEQDSDRGECQELNAETLTRCTGRMKVHYETIAGQIGFPVWTCSACGKVVVK
jgi:hypothetical protein